MKSFEIKGLGLEEITNEELATIEGGIVIRYYTGDNPLIYAGNAAVNGAKYVVHGVMRLFGKQDVLTYEYYK